MACFVQHRNALPFMTDCRNSVSMTVVNYCVADKARRHRNLGVSSAGGEVKEKKLLCYLTLTRAPLTIVIFNNWQTDSGYIALF